jgi:hypothetical protein
MSISSYYYIVDKRSPTEDYNNNINEIRSNCNNNQDKNEFCLEYNYDLNSKIEDNKGKHFLFSFLQKLS